MKALKQAFAPKYAFDTVVIDIILAAGLAVHEHPCSNGINHLTIRGGVRNVEYYPTTQTIYCNSTDKFKPLKTKGGVQTAITIAQQGTL